jgi:hypothetical protein
MRARYPTRQPYTNVRFVFAHPCYAANADIRWPSRVLTRWNYFNKCRVRLPHAVL